MENDDLKTMWKEIHIENRDNNCERINIYALKGKNHGQMMEQVVTDVKWKIGGYCMGLTLLAALMSYAILYLELNLQVASVTPFIGIGLFFLIQTGTEIIRLRILAKSDENRSVKESLIFFRRKVNRMKKFDFLSYLIFFYLLAIGIIYLHLKDIGGMKNLATGNGTQPLIIVLLLLFLAVPWFMKYQNNLRYKKLFSDLNNSANYLNDAS
jgi:hypothetical protein